MRCCFKMYFSLSLLLIKMLGIANAGNVENEHYVHRVTHWNVPTNSYVLKLNTPLVIVRVRGGAARSCCTWATQTRLWTPLAPRGGWNRTTHIKKVKFKSGLY